ncbi:hypothetical protein SAY87_024608 [Trapa incisa]|uniref:Uncharacterized protein n=1 Tax=Trapa incisa TaxID=236973 RepID=A0AAN7G9P3_9MYRT|nr:hypothetical protein SAY87_024608 [Trapa incisa]
MKSWIRNYVRESSLWDLRAHRSIIPVYSSTTSPTLEKLYKHPPLSATSPVYFPYKYPSPPPSPSPPPPVILRHYHPMISCTRTINPPPPLLPPVYKCARGRAFWRESLRIRRTRKLLRRWIYHTQQHGAVRFSFLHLLYKRFVYK